MEKLKNKSLTIYYDYYNLFKFLLILFILFIVYIGIKEYLVSVDKRTNKIVNNTESSFVLKKPKLLDNNMYFIDLEKDLNKVVKKSQNTITYKIDKEDFNLDVKVYLDKTNNKHSYEIVKVVDNLHDISARINYKNAKQLEYRQDSNGGPLIIKFITLNEVEILAITDQTYYFLGEDVDDITFDNNEFYYKTINPKYEVKELREKGCTQEINNSIEDFSFQDVYYTYGRINFLDDYYQKHALRTTSVEEECKLIQK